MRGGCEGSGVRGWGVRGVTVAWGAAHLSPHSPSHFHPLQESG